MPLLPDVHILIVLLRRLMFVHHSPSSRALPTSSFLPYGGIPKLSWLWYNHLSYLPASPGRLPLSFIQDREEYSMALEFWLS